MSIENPDVLLKLIFSHLLADFILQPASWVAHKEKYIYTSPIMYLHALLHAALAWLLVGEGGFWPLALVIGVSHLAIDITKAGLQKEYPRQHKRWFLLDQLLHFIILLYVWMWYNWGALRFDLLPFSLSWVKLTAYLFVSRPASVIMKIAISHWKIQADVGAQSGRYETTVTEEASGLSRAGAWIGVLERLLVLTFVITGHWEAVGFLLAAKSVFRFGDLRNSKEVYMTEYILIGTLLSFGLAILTGLLVNYLLALTG